MRRYKRKPNLKSKKLKNAIRKIAKDVVMKDVETIKSVNSISDGQEIAHNSYISLSDNLLYTTQGDKNPEASAGSNRTGDQITLRGVSLKFMVELNERYGDVTFRLMVVKCARGDNPAASGNLWNGASGNRMLDTINTDRYSILYQKYFKLTARNMGTEVPANNGILDTSGTSNHTSGQDWWSQSRATRIVKVYIPGKRFTRSGVIQYENDSPNPKFFDYRVLLYAYSNYSTSGVYNVARLNDVVKVMYYKDA